MKNRFLLIISALMFFMVFSALKLIGETIHELAMLFFSKDSDGNTIVEDVKGVSKGRSGTSTDTFIIKQKLLIQLYREDIIFRIV